MLLNLFNRLAQLIEKVQTFVVIDIHGHVFEPAHQRLFLDHYLHFIKLVLIFWMFQNPGDLLFSLIKGMAMATVIVLVGCYYGYNASGGPVGVGTATAKSMVLNIVLVHLIGMLGTQVFWGANPRAPIGG